MALRVQVQPELLRWAADRSGLDPEELRRKFPKLAEWEEGDLAPTLRQLESFARTTKSPIGYLLLDAPPELPLPIPDFRTMRDEGVPEATPDLLETVYQCQQRQEWYRSFAQETGEERLAFVGSLTTQTPVADAAAAMHASLSYAVGTRGSSWSEAMRTLTDEAEALGALVMVNGVVGSNPRRPLNPREFRGFALVDELAPVVFVNGADTKAAQVFTLAHELAHLWLGQSALSDATPYAAPDQAVERWCNQVAAEFLVPETSVAHAFNGQRDMTEELERLARLYRVSTLVVLRRVFDTGQLGWDAFRAAYRAEEERVRALAEERDTTGGSGNFYNTQPRRVSKRFARALVDATIEGRTLYRDAFQLLGVRKASTFDSFADRLRTAD